MHDYISERTSVLLEHVNTISGLSMIRKAIYQRMKDDLVTFQNCYPPASEASREVENVDWKKIHMPPYMVSKNLSVCLSQNSTPII